MDKKTCILIRLEPRTKRMVRANLPNIIPQKEKTSSSLLVSGLSPNKQIIPQTLYQADSPKTTNITITVVLITRGHCFEQEIDEQ